MWWRGSAAGEKESPLEKDKASGASKDWSLCPLELTAADLGSTGTSKGYNVAVSGLFFF